MSLITGLYLGQNKLVEGYTKITPTNKQIAWIILFIVIMVLILSLLAASDKNPNIITVPTVSLS
jgi:hypothetical protein